MAPTKKQRQIFEALLFLRRKGEMPTVREVGALVGLRSSATVMKHLKALEREGLISLSGKSRGIRCLVRSLPDEALPERSFQDPFLGESNSGSEVAFEEEAFAEGAFRSNSSARRAGGIPASGIPASGIPLVGRIAAGAPIEAV